MKTIFITFFLLSPGLYPSIEILSSKEQDENHRKLLTGTSLLVGSVIILGIDILSKKNPLLTWEKDNHWEQRFLRLYKEEDLFPDQINKEIMNKTQAQKQSSMITLKIVNLLMDTYVQDVLTNCLIIFKNEYTFRIKDLNRQLNSMRLKKAANLMFDLENFSNEDYNYFENSVQQLGKINNLFDLMQQYQKENVKDNLMCQEFSMYIWEHIHMSKYMFDVEGAFFFFKEHLFNDKDENGIPKMNSSTYQNFISKLDKEIHEINDQKKAQFFKTFYYTWLNFYIKNDDQFNLYLSEDQLN